MIVLKNGDLDTFKENPTHEKAKEILQRIRNNRVTDSTFCKEIEGQLEEVRKYLKENKQAKTAKEKDAQIKPENMKQLKENNERVSLLERQEAVSELKKLRNQMQAIVKREGEEIEQ